MTSVVVRMGEGHESPGKLKEIIISCDHIDCMKSESDTTIRSKGGLKEMGWQAVFISPKMRHYCPEHRREG